MLNKIISYIAGVFYVCPKCGSANVIHTKQGVYCQDCKRMSI